MNQYICRVCKGNECTVLTSQGPPNCGCLHNSDIGALWEQDSSFKSERDAVLERLHIWFENYCEGNEDPDLWVAFLHAERTLRQKCKEVGNIW